MPITFSTILSNLWNFIKKPRLNHLPDYLKAQPIQAVGYLLLLDFMLMIPLSGFLGLLGINEMDHKIDDLTDDPLQLAAFAVIMAPLVEEAIFRLPMKFSYPRMMIALGTVLLLLPSLIASQQIALWIIGTILFLVFLYHLINERSNNRFSEQVGSWWEQGFSFPFWFLTIGFALLHLSNFGSFPVHLAPLLVLPQFVLGAILGYVRTGFGFLYAVLFHALHNGILVGLATIASSAEKISEAAETGWWIL